MAESVTLEKERVELADDALREIDEVVAALQAHIASNDESQHVVHLARGMLARIKDLSQAASECIEHRREERGDDSKLIERITCRRVAPPGDEHA